MTTLSYSLTLQSDWHVGSGSGIPGSTDRLVLRDADGLPYLGGKAAHGLWRDACELAAWGLDGGNVGAWCAWVDAIFGAETGREHDPDRAHSPSREPSRKRVRIRAARLPQPLREALRSSPIVLSAVTHVVPGVAIDRDTGRAADDQLRFIEMARAGARLRGTVEIDPSLPETQQRLAMAMLVLGASWWERLGGKRRRGAGRCVVELDGPGWPSANEAYELLSAAPQAGTGPELPPPPVVLPPETDVQASRRMPPAVAWTRIALSMEALTPLVIRDHLIGNVVTTLSYLPGSLLARPILERLRRVLPGADAAFRCGALVITNGYIELDGEPSFPAPICLVRDKKAKDGVSPFTNRLVEPDGTNSVSPPVGAYVTSTPDGSLLLVGRPRFGSTTHSVIDDERQRPTEEVGGVFTYEWIAAKTRFRAELLMDPSLACDVGAISAAIAGTIAVGAAHGDEYGLVAIDATVAAAAVAPPLEGADTLVVWLLSDLLVRDAALRPAAGPQALQRALEQALGCALMPHVLRKDGPPLLTLPARRESFAEAWGLPRATLLGVGAGSVAVFRASPANGAAADAVWRSKLSSRVAEVVAAGLGERRGEGFGRLAVNHPLLRAPASGRIPLETDVAMEAMAGPARPLPVGGDAEDLTYAHAIERAAWRQEIARAAERQAKAEARKLRFSADQPGRAQLGNLRTVLARVVAERGGQPLIAWLDQLKGVKAREEAWSPSLRRLQDLATKPSEVWQALDLGSDDRSARLVATQDGAAHLRAALWPEALQACLVHAIRAATRGGAA